MPPPANMYKWDHMEREIKNGEGKKAIRTKKEQKGARQLRTKQKGCSRQRGFN